MTIETCRIQYEQAKKQGRGDEMTYWKNRILSRGGTVEEEKPKKQKIK